VNNGNTITRVRTVPVRWRLVRPFVTALGQKSYSDNVLARVRLASGVEGWGEASSSLANPGQTGPKMAAALRRLGRRFLGRDARDLQKIVAEVWKIESETPAAVGAFECAVTDALCRQEGIPFFKFFGGARREIKTLMSVSAVSPDRVDERVRDGRRRGFDGFKLKLNGREPLDLNLARVLAARRAAPKARLLLDPNQSYRPETLSELLFSLGRDGLRVDSVEEPFPKGDWKTLARYQECLGAGPRLKSYRGDGRRPGSGKGSLPPLILDESIQNPADARLVARRGLADGVNVKLAKSGLARSREIVGAFKPSALFMIGCMAESKIGLAAAAQFAMGLGCFDYADLDSDLLLKPLNIPGGYIRRGPWLTLPKKPVPGLGVSL